MKDTHTQMLGCTEIKEEYRNMCTCWSLQDVDTQFSSADIIAWIANEPIQPNVFKVTPTPTITNIYSTTTPFKTHYIYSVRDKISDWKKVTHTSTVTRVANRHSKRIVLSHLADSGVLFCLNSGNSFLICWFGYQTWSPFDSRQCMLYIFLAAMKLWDSLEYHKNGREIMHPQDYAIKGNISGPRWWSISGYRFFTIENK